MWLKKSRFSLLKADYIILNAYVHCEFQEMTMKYFFKNLCDHVISLVTLKQL